MKFWGYRRPDGRVGVRNHVLVMPTIVCANQVAEGISKAVKGTVSFVHQHGCAQIGADYDQTMRTFVGLGSHPNVSGVVVVGLGCEAHGAKKVAEKIAATGKPVEVVVIQEAGGTLNAIAQGARHAMAMVQAASMETRVECDLNELILATECGGSDACSGISANPALGAASDRVVDVGGTVILAETTELIGAEHLLARRAVNEQVACRCYEVIERMEKGAMALGVDIRGAQPSPGNIEGGITTIEEKSLGCIHKGGTRPLQEVVEYAERPARKGLVWMDTPGMDIDQLVGMVAGGAQVVVFTTGRGTPTGSPIAPVLKVATNSRMYENMKDNMDLNAGTILTGNETIEQVGNRILQEVLQVCSGKLTKSEILGHREFGIYRIGPTI